MQIDGAPVPYAEPAENPSFGAYQTWVQNCKWDDWCYPRLLIQNWNSKKIPVLFKLTGWVRDRLIVFWRMSLLKQTVSLQDF